MWQISWYWTMEFFTATNSKVSSRVVMLTREVTCSFVSGSLLPAKRDIPFKQSYCSGQLKAKYIVRNVLFEVACSRENLWDTKSVLAIKGEQWGRYHNQKSNLLCYYVKFESNHCFIIHGDSSIYRGATKAVKQWVQLLLLEGKLSVKMEKFSTFIYGKWVNCCHRTLN